MKTHTGRFAALIVATSISVSVGLSGDHPDKSTQPVSFKDHIMPVLGKYCLPCHAAESENRSELSLDNYQLLMKGGKHGVAVVAGKPEESSLILKLGEKPPFGDQMPLARRRRSPESVKKLTEEEIRTITEWIRQGAREN